MKPDVIVLGGGVIGLASALALLDAGCSVRVLERGSAPARESSWAGGGIVCPLRPWDEPEAVAQLFVETLQRYPGWVAQIESRSGLAVEYRVSGIEWSLPAPDIERAIEWHRQAERPFAVMASGLLSPLMAQVRPPRLGRALVEAVHQQGGGMQLQATMRPHVRGGRVIGVIGPDGAKIAADAVVVAAGAWSGQVLAATGTVCAIEPVKGQMLRLQVAGAAQRPISIGEDVYVIPRADDQVIVGSTLERVGFDAQPTVEARERLYVAAINLCPWLKGAAVLQQWAGLRPARADGTPIIGAGPVPGLWINTGHYRNGIALAPASADRLVKAMGL